MRLRGKLLAGIGSLAVLPCLAPAGASAATEFGEECLGNAGVQNTTLVQLAQAPGSALPLAAPTSGVITTWKLTIAPPPMPVPTRLKLLRPTADPKKFETVGESDMETIVAGLNSFATRIPIEAGDRLGLFSPTKEPAGTVYCSGSAPGDVIGGILGEAQVGSPAVVVAGDSELALPVAAVIEPDADRDGFGDETQDRCPQSASVQATCPLLALDALGQAGKNSVSILVATSLEAPVAVSGTVNFRRGPKKARTSAQATLSAPPQTVSPGAIAVFTLSFPKALKAALAKLPRRRSLTLTASAGGQSPAGVVASDSVTIKLRGRR